MTRIAVFGIVASAAVALGGRDARAQAARATSATVVYRAIPQVQVEPPRANSCPSDSLVKLVKSAMGLFDTSLVLKSSFITAASDQRRPVEGQNRHYYDPEYVQSRGFLMPEDITSGSKIVVSRAFKGPLLMFLLAGHYAPRLQEILVEAAKASVAGGAPTSPDALAKVVTAGYKSLLSKIDPYCPRGPVRPQDQNYPERWKNDCSKLRDGWYYSPFVAEQVAKLKPPSGGSFAKVSDWIGEIRTDGVFFGTACTKNGPFSAADNLANNTLGPSDRLNVQFPSIDAVPATLRYLSAERVRDVKDWLRTNRAAVRNTHLAALTGDAPVTQSICSRGRYHRDSSGFNAVIPYPDPIHAQCDWTVALQVNATGARGSMSVASNSILYCDGQMDGYQPGGGKKKAILDRTVTTHRAGWEYVRWGCLGAYPRKEDCTPARREGYSQLLKELRRLATAEGCFWDPGRIDLPVTEASANALTCFYANGSADQQRAWRLSHLKSLVDRREEIKKKFADADQVFAAIANERCRCPESQRVNFYVKDIESPNGKKKTEIQFYLGHLTHYFHISPGKIPGWVTAARIVVSLLIDAILYAIVPVVGIVKGIVDLVKYIDELTDPPHPQGSFVVGVDGTINLTFSATTDKIVPDASGGGSAIYRPANLPGHGDPFAAGGVMHIDDTCLPYLSSLGIDKKKEGISHALACEDWMTPTCGTTFDNHDDVVKLTDPAQREAKKVELCCASREGGGVGRRGSACCWAFARGEIKPNELLPTVNGQRTCADTFRKLMLLSYEYDFDPESKDPFTRHIASACGPLKRDEYAGYYATQSARSDFQGRCRGTLQAAVYRGLLPRCVLTGCPAEGTQNFARNWSPDNFNMPPPPIPRSMVLLENVRRRGQFYPGRRFEVEPAVNPPFFTLRANIDTVGATKRTFDTNIFVRMIEKGRLTDKPWRRTNITLLPSVEIGVVPFALLGSGVGERAVIGAEAMSNGSVSLGNDSRAAQTLCNAVKDLAPHPIDEILALSCPFIYDIFGRGFVREQMAHTVPVLLKSVLAGKGFAASAASLDALLDGVFGMNDDLQKEGTQKNPGLDPGAAMRCGAQVGNSTQTECKE